MRDCANEGPAAAEAVPSESSAAGNGARPRARCGLGTCGFLYRGRTTQQRSAFIGRKRPDAGGEFVMEKRGSVVFYGLNELERVTVSLPGTRSAVAFWGVMIFGFRPARCRVRDGESDGSVPWPQARRSVGPRCTRIRASRRAFISLRRWRDAVFFEAGCCEEAEKFSSPGVIGKPSAQHGHGQGPRATK